MKAPNVTVLTSTSVHVTWQEPALPNGIVLGYGLHQKSGGVETVLFSGAGFSFTVNNLQPYTVYQFRVNASTVAGSGFSEWTQVTTLEDGRYGILFGVGVGGWALLKREHSPPCVGKCFGTS